MLSKWRGAKARGVNCAQPWLSGAGLILMFHRVVTPETPVFDTSLAIDADSLDRLLTYIRAQNWEFVSANELHDRLLANDTHRQPFVCCTFDDGYIDNLRTALPIFRRHQVPFCVNIAVGYVDRTLPAWWDALSELLLQREEIEFRAYGQSERVSVATWEEKTDAFHRFRATIHQEVKEGRPPFQDSWIANGVDPLRLSDRYFMTWKELQELAQDPLVEIGAHTVTHPYLQRLSGNEAGDEIELSRRILEEKLGMEVCHFAYPFGDCGQREFRMVEELKFKTAVTTQWHNVFPLPKQRLSSLPRKFFWRGDVAEPTIRTCLYGTVPT